MTTGATGTLDEAYEPLHATGPEFDGWLSNHGSMAAEAMVRHGHAGSVHPHGGSSSGHVSYTAGRTRPGDAFGAADSTAGTSDLADGLYRRSPRLVGAGWLNPGERRRAGCRVPYGLLRAVRGVVASGAGGCRRWLAQAGLMCRAVRRRLAAGSAASTVRESVAASVTVAWFSQRMATRRATWRATWAGACRRSGERRRAACRGPPRYRAVGGSGGGTRRW
jgi:hypothetical protein